LAVDANFPGQEAIGFDLGFAEFTDRGFVAARQRFKGKVPVLVETDEVIVTRGGDSLVGVQRIGDVLEEKGAMAFEVGAQVGG
jgi:hypothetical protein